MESCLLSAAVMAWVVLPLWLLTRNHAVDSPLHPVTQVVEHMGLVSAKRVQSVGAEGVLDLYKIQTGLLKNRLVGI